MQIGSPPTERVLGKADSILADYARQGDAEWAKESQTIAPEARDAFRLIRLIELTIAEDTSGTVGGPIDALELRRGGEVRWIARKDNCPAE